MTFKNEPEGIKKLHVEDQGVSVSLDKNSYEYHVIETFFL
jgi:hypothetical protein